MLHYVETDSSSPFPPLWQLPLHIITAKLFLMWIPRFSRFSTLGELSSHLLSDICVFLAAELLSLTDN